ncbi:MAG: restriction endonuclease subunit S [Luteolibacter sp.]
MNAKPYPKYKPSGVEFLGEVPEHWDVKKMTYGFSRIGSGTTPKSDSGDFYDGDIPWVTTSELREKVITKTKSSITDIALAQHSALRLYPIGTVLFAMYGATIGRLGILGLEATLNQACCAFAKPTLFDPQFVFYWLWMRRPVLISLATGGGQPNLSQDDLRQIRIPIPKLPEQQVIADFLDDRTAKLDGLLEKKRALIGKLKEKRSALISRTVTKGLPPEAAAQAGLPPNPKLKPSGISWLGDIPEHWDLLTVRRKARRVQTGGTPPTAEERYYEAGTVPWYGPSSFNDDITVSQPVKFLNQSAVNERAARMFSAGATMIITIGATIGKVTSLEEPGSCNQQITVVEFDERWVHPSFATYQLKRLEPALRAIAPSATLPILDQGEIGDLPFAIPSLEEQVVIVDYLKIETSKIDRMIEKVESAIEKLTEYRTALITAAVTGKIDVRNAA